MIYVARDISKFAEQDDYKEGCLMGTGSMYPLNVSFQGDTPDEVIKKIAEFLDVEEDAIERNACDEDGRVDFAKTETADSLTPSKEQLAQWKRGKLKMWYVVYTAYIEKCEPVRV